MYLTWKEFKKAVEDSGVKEDTQIDFIDISYPTNSSDVSVVFDKGNNIFLCM